MLQTEFDFVLPKGLLTENGESLHRQGRMRLATAKDEMYVQNHPRVQREPEYRDLVMLARVITGLGSITEITSEDLEQLFSQDLAYLRELFNQINQNGNLLVPANCPQCNHCFQVELVPVGES